MRKVKIYEKVWTGWNLKDQNNENDTRPYTYTEIGEGYFHTFGLNFEELEQGIANYSIALIELSDGHIKEFTPDCIQFIESMG